MTESTFSKAWPIVGQIVTETRSFSQEDFDRFAMLSGDDNPIHVDEAFATTTRFGRPVAHGMLLYSAVCGALSKHFPDAVQVEQSMMFPAPTYAAEEMTIRIEVLDGLEDGLRASIKMINPAGGITLEGETTLQRSVR
ncbi:MAG: MaoC/PaaZ C-terminal domain-containing protein [Chloroflexota bacterium]